MRTLHILNLLLELLGQPGGRETVTTKIVAETLQIIYIVFYDVYYKITTLFLGIK